MIDIKFLRENPDIVRENIKKKFQDAKLPLVDEVIELDAEKRATQQKADSLRASRNKLSKQIGALMGQGKKAEAEEVKAQVKAQSDELIAAEAKEKELDEKILKIMSSLRAESLTQIDTLKVLKVRDYEKNTITDLATGEVTESGLPQSNVLYYDLEDGAWACVRPSGTEPKIKLYYGIKGTSLDDADAKLEALQTALVEKLNKLAE